MDNKKENIFIRTFIAKNKRNRMEYELKNSQKRNVAIHRFAHRAEDHILENKIYFYGKNLIFNECLLNIEGFCKPSKVYVLCNSDDIDGTYLDYKEAMELDNRYAPYILLVNNNIACIVTEPMSGSYNRYILRNI